MGGTFAYYENKQRELLETIISHLPLDNSSITANTSSLFGLLRSVIILNASEKCRTILEMKIGSQLEKATLDDLLIPSYSYLNDTLYDIDIVERLLIYFLQNVAAVSSSLLTVVGKLIDGVLGEIASDGNLKPEKFYKLASSLPQQARLYDDGLYRGIDIYLKSHPWILEKEKEMICSAMDCRKLTLEGCIHAAQNERLPLRAVIQVLFLEKLQIRQAISGTLLMAEDGDDETAGEGEVEKTVRENQVLRLEINTMRSRVYQLEKECFYLKKVMKKIDKVCLSEAKDETRKWSISKKLGCKFTTQVCDSHQATMIDRRSRRS